MTHFSTGSVGDIEALSLYRRVGVERHVQPVVSGHDRVRQTAATQPSQLASASVVSVEDFQTVIRALHVRFQLEVVERLRADIITQYANVRHQCIKRIVAEPLMR